MTVRTLLTWHLDLLGVPRRSFFELLAPFATEPRERDRLLELASTAGQVRVLQVSPVCCRRMVR